MTEGELRAFLLQSRQIEGYDSDPTPGEMAQAGAFLASKAIAVEDLQRYVGEAEPRAILRSRVGLNVRVGTHIPPPGGPQIERDLVAILRYASGPALARESAYEIHHRYESLRPFTDGNGRSGRLLWLWCMRRVGLMRLPPLGFLHAWYYQSLEAGR